MKLLEKIVMLLSDLIFLFDLQMEKNKKAIIITILMANYLILSFERVHWFIVVLMLACSWFLLYELVRKQNKE